MEMQLWCQAINNSLGLPVSQQWDQHKTDILTADTSCISDVCYKFHPSGIFFSQMWLPACGLSCNTAGNARPERPPCSSPAFLLSAPVQPGPQPSPSPRAVVPC